MSKRLENIKVPIDQELEEHLSWLVPDHGEYRILRQSVDARTRHSPHFVFSVEVAEKGEKLSAPPIELEKLDLLNSKKFKKPIIVGTGPAGLFAAIRLVERGIPCILLERGSKAETRIKGINQFWRYGKLDQRNNVCFGEGGAGLYSDGKLITRIKSPHIPYVLNRLVQFGAPAEIEWLSNPHVGSDKIRRLIPKLRSFLIQNGCEIHFDCQVMELIYQGNKVCGVKTEYGKTFESDHVVLATGHSANDMFDHLASSGVFLEGKSFAMGLRIEHPQSLINQIQFREFATHPKLGSANYKLVTHDQKTNTGVYSFCMCPGGFVLSSGTEENGIVCNGMSNYNRNSKWANAAIVVSIDHNTHFGKDLFGGMKLRSQLEQKAFFSVRASGGTKQLPGQKLVDFLDRKSTELLPGSSPSGAIPTRLDEILPSFMLQSMMDGFKKFDSNMKGFISEHAQLYGVESRTSCPLRITRDPVTLQSLSHQGLFPAGEGAGYAGGITSAACDGVRIADRIFEELS